MTGESAESRARRLAGCAAIGLHPMLNAPWLEINPFAGIKVEGVKPWKEDDERGFDPEQALTILSATVATPSHLISKETKAARRWVPWICAHTGARMVAGPHPDQVC